MLRKARVVDVVSSEVRSRMMSGIRARDTRPELQVRRYLHSRGFRFRVTDRSLPGCPDLVLRKWRTAIFVHGCFWHGHGSCRFFRLPSTRPEFWRSKIEKNVLRDRQCAEQLLTLGWRVAIVWECALREDSNSALTKLEQFLRGSDAQLVIRSKVQDRIE